MTELIAAFQTPSIFTKSRSASSEAFDGITYEKGSAVIGMIERWLGEARFRAGVRAHLAAHADGNAESADLWAALRLAARGDGDVDVPGAMATFIDQPGLPLVSVEILPHGQVRLAQRRFHNAGVAVKEQRWRVPVSLKFSDGKTVTTRTVLLTEAQKVIPLTDGELAWVFPLAEAKEAFYAELDQHTLMDLAGARRLSTVLSITIERKPS